MGISIIRTITSYIVGWALSRDRRVAIAPEDVPAATGLREAGFRKAEPRAPFT